MEKVSSGSWMSKHDHRHTETIAPLEMERKGKGGKKGQLKPHKSKKGRKLMFQRVTKTTSHSDTTFLFPKFRFSSVL